VGLSRAEDEGRFRCGHFYQNFYQAGRSQRIHLDPSDALDALSSWSDRVHEAAQRVRAEVWMA
jgi:hypothetical protein